MLGYSDVHSLCSVRLMSLWTGDVEEWWQGSNVLGM